MHRRGNAGTQQRVRHLRRAGSCRVPAGQSRHGRLSVYACTVAEPYTSTTWIVKPGQEDEFVRRWTEFAEWSAGQGLAAPAMLLRDVDEPTRFVSFGPWENLQMIWRWRGLTGFQERVASLNEVLVSFEPRTLELVGGRRRRWRLKRS
jgi:heme-degrading monooxygenase HmoA